MRNWNAGTQTSTLICHNCDHKDEYIEELEAEAEELKAVNTEWSAEDFGGWITDRVPTKEECGDSPFGKEFAVTIDSNRIETMVMEFVYETVRGKEVARWKWKDRISPWKVIAWHKLPKPYRGAKAIDRACRNHGSCEWCKGNRTNKNDKMDLK